MVFSYTVDSPRNDTSKYNGRTSIKNNLVMVWGTWTAGAAANGTIVTGLSVILAHSTRTDTGTITSEHKSKKNVTGGGVAAPGSIGILLCAVDNVGSWVAWGYA